MTTTYRIHEYERTYRTRGQYVSKKEPWRKHPCTPNSRGKVWLDSHGWDGKAAVGVYNDLVDLAHKSGEWHGILIHGDGSAMDLAYLAAATRTSEKDLTRAIQFLAHPPQCDWLEPVELRDGEWVPVAGNGCVSVQQKDSAKDGVATKDTPAPASTTPCDKKMAQLVTEFDEEVWPAYPNKDGRAKAREYYVNARKRGVTKELVLAKIDEYKRSIEYQRKTGFAERQYKIGSSWFNQKGWEDDYPLPAPIVPPDTEVKRAALLDKYKQRILAASPKQHWDIVCDGEAKHGLGRDLKEWYKERMGVELRG